MEESKFKSNRLAAEPVLPLCRGPCCVRGSAGEGSDAASRVHSFCHQMSVASLLRSRLSAEAEAILVNQTDRSLPWGMEGVGRWGIKEG